MTKVTTFKAVTLTRIILVAVLVSLLFVFVIGGGDGGRKLGSIPLPGIKLASAAQANVLAQTLALDTSAAGMMAHLDLDIDGLNPLGLSSGEGTSPGFLSSVKERLVGTNGIASVQDFGDNFIIARWCVPNRVNCVNINLYVDSAGHIAAYLGPTEPSARIWQAQALAVTNPALTDVNFDNVLVGGPFSVSQGGIKEGLDSVGHSLGTTITGVPVHDNISYFHFGLTGALIAPGRLLMMGKAFTAQNTTKTINFVLPESISTNILEVSWAFYGVGGNTLDPFMNLDGVRLVTLNRFDCCTTQLRAGIIGNLETFKAQVAHNLQINMPNFCCGSVGGALMIIYDDPAG